MDVRAFAVHKLAEHSEFGEIEGKHFNFAVAAVFKLHAVAFGLFAGFYKFPTFINCECRRHLGEYVLAAAHRRELHGNMERPGRGVVDDIDVRILAEFLPRLVAEVFLGRGLVFP